MRIGISIDVPDLAAGIRFYGGLLDLPEGARPLPHLCVLGGGAQSLLLIERAEGTNPCRDPQIRRGYARHWTPVHLDFHVADVPATRDRARALGATLEAYHEVPGRPPAAFMADPFGHGFCLIGSR
ncbi:VOC family protein [Roseicyclus sp.]|uniref:VOC family protein n=1 Tax=Roseicyclus sp. TaxID=1914329 RepID=UPI003F9EC3D9